jgi:hypothetical protein
MTAPKRAGCSPSGRRTARQDRATSAKRLTSGKGLTRAESRRILLPVLNRLRIPVRPTHPTVLEKRSVVSHTVVEARAEAGRVTGSGGDR